MKTITKIHRVITVVLLLTISACSTMDDDTNVNTDKRSLRDIMRENGNNPDEAVFSHRPRGTVYVYTESNGLDVNSIHVYKRTASGDLVFFDKFNSGGTGNGEALKSLGALQLDINNKFLYAVNAGSKSISSFRVLGNGILSLKATVDSGGTFPISLSIFGNTLYVVNGGESKINGFRLNDNGGFAPIPGSERMLSSPLAGPAQISFSPNGAYLYVTEKNTDKISIFPVNAEGVAGPRLSIASVGKTPSGIAFARDNFMVVSNAESGNLGQASVTSYGGILNGNAFSLGDGAISNSQTAASGAATTQNGRYAYIANVGSDTLSSFYINDEGALLPVFNNIVSGDGPTDIVVAGDNYYVYALCANEHTIQIYTRDELGGLTRTDKVEFLPVFAVGLATTFE